MKVTIRLLAVAVATVAALVAVPLSASASSSISSGSSQSVFAAQARNAGLTSAQAAALQTRVNAYLAKDNGTQVAANEILLSGGADLLLTLPGQTIARHINGTAASATATRPSECWPGSLTYCPYLYMCGWSQPYGYGDVVTAYYCGRDVEVPNSFTTYGSWINSESNDTRAYFKNAHHRTVYTTRGAYSYNGYYNWHPVWYIDAC